MKNPNLLLKTPILFLFTLLLAATASVQSVHAATITVTNTADSGTGSLRQAISDAAAGDTIDFQSGLSGTIILTTGELLISKNLTISGPGANTLAVSGNNASRVFFIDSGQITISGLTITGGRQDGGFRNSGVLTLSNCVVHDNPGGGIGNFGAVMVTNSTISQNQGRGGIYNDGGAVTVTNSTISGNSSADQGGGIFNDGGAVTVTNSTIKDNAATDGGGISNNGFHFSATLTITNSTLSNNSASSSGGSIFNAVEVAGDSATLTVTNSTISGNSAYQGGGIYLLGAPDEGASPTLTISDTILSTGGSGANIANDSGTVMSHGYNLSSDSGGDCGGITCLNGPGDQINTDPMLGPLQDNGGPTFTHELLTGSPAINAGDPNFTPPPDNDQRGPGYPRVVNGRIDIGSFEVQAPPVCPQPQGYWKNNPAAWPVNSLTLGSQTYTKTELLMILMMPVGTGPKADASLILADQLIAAKLNIANGAGEPDPVPATITDADAVLSFYPGMLPYRVRTNSTNGQQMVNDAATLESFNKGLLTTGCSG